MRPTVLSAVLVAIGIPISLGINFAAPDFWPIVLVYLLVVLLLIGADGANSIFRRSIKIDIDVPQQIFIGEQEDLKLYLLVGEGQNQATVEILMDVDGCLVPPEQILDSLISGTRSEVSIPLAPTRRGEGVVDRIWLRWHGPFRLVRFVVIYPVNIKIPIVPNIKSVRRQAISLTSPDLLYGQKRRSVQGDGSEFDSLREWVPGLDNRSIDWKHSARHRKLVCKDFQAESNHQIILAFDTGYLMCESVDGAPRIDHAINAGLLLAYTSLRAGDRVGLFAFDTSVRQALTPHGGPGQFERLRYMTSQFDYSTDETNFTLGLMDLIGRLNRRSLIIVQSEFTDTVTAELMVDNLTRLAKRHLIIFATQTDPMLEEMAYVEPRSIKDVTRSVFAYDFLNERKVIHERLRRLGIHCIDVPASRLNAELLDRYATVKRLEMI